MYIGEQEIKEINGEVVTFTDGLKVEYSKDYIEYLSTEEPIKLDELFIRKVSKMKSDFLKVFINSSANKYEINRALSELPNELTRHEKNVISNLFGKTNYQDIDFRQVNKLALELNSEDFTN